MVFLRLSGRALVNIHSANAEGAVGNYMGLSKMFLVRRASSGYEVSEDVVISGNMLKHWHAINMVERLKSMKRGDLCQYCSRHVMYRSPITGKDEFEFIKRCAIEDLHGFLQPESQIRRESLIKFSFMMPVEERRAEYEAITHNRVVLTPEGKIPSEEAEMMVFKREHASGIYGFLVSADLAYVGRCLSDPDNSSKTLNIEDRKSRVKAALLALSDLLSGRFGAASSRALPAVRVSELLCAISRDPLPNLIHGFYMDWATESVKVLSLYVGGGVGELKVLAAGEGPKQAISGAEKLKGVAEVFDSPFDALSRMVEVALSWMR